MRGGCSGVECMVIASVPTLAGGSMNEASALKGGRLGQIVLENRLPVINLTQSVSTLSNPHTQTLSISRNSTHLSRVVPIWNNSSRCSTEEEEVSDIKQYCKSTPCGLPEL